MSSSGHSAARDAGAQVWGPTVDILMNGYFQENRIAPGVLSTLLRRACDRGLCFRACGGRGCNSGHRGRAVAICSIVQADGFHGATRTCTPIVVSTHSTPDFGFARTAGARGRSWPCGSRRSTRTGRSRRGAWPTWGHGVRGTDRAHRCSGHHRADWSIGPRGAEWVGWVQRRHWRGGIPRTTRARGHHWIHWLRWSSGNSRPERRRGRHRPRRPRGRYWRRGVQRVDRERRRTRTRRADRAGGTQRRHGIPRDTRTCGRDGLCWCQWIPGSYRTRRPDGVLRTNRPDGLHRV
jgi:hypothetical protein